MASLDTRLAQIERHHGDIAQRQARLAEDAAFVRDKLLELADRFDDADRSSAWAAQQRWSGAMRVACALRFAPDQVNTLISEYLA